MAEIKIYGKLVNSTTEKAIVDAFQVAGGFMSLTTSEINELTPELKKTGMLVFDTDQNKFFQLQDVEGIQTWVNVLRIEDKQEKLTSANAGDNITIEEVDGITKINAIRSDDFQVLEELPETPSATSPKLVFQLKDGALYMLVGIENSL